MLRFCFDAGLDFHRLDGASAHLPGDLAGRQGTSSGATLRRALPQRVVRESASRFAFFSFVVCRCVLLCALAPAGDHGFCVTTESERKDLEVLERARRQLDLNRPAQAPKGGGKGKPSGFVCMWVAVRLDCMCARFDFRTVPLRRAAAAAPAAEAAAEEEGLINTFYDECLQLCLTSVDCFRASEKEVARATASEKEEGRRDLRPKGPGVLNSSYDECVHVDLTSIDCFRADDGAVAQQLAELKGLLKK